MKKAILPIIFILLFVTPSYALTSEQNLRTTTATKSTDLNKTNNYNFINRNYIGTESSRTKNQENQVSNLKHRADTEITRRVNYLNQLIKRLDQSKKLSDAQKSDLKSQVQTQINGLNLLKAKIDADTDLTTLKADVKSIISDYYIFLFFRLKIDLLFATDRLGVTADNLSTIYTKLQTRANDAKSKGQDVTGLESLLSDMQAKIAEAKSQFQAAQTELTGLNAQGYPGNRATLLDARAKIKLGTQDLRLAYQDAIKIRQGLIASGIFKIKPSSTESATANKNTER